MHLILRKTENCREFLESRDKIEKFFEYLNIWLYFYKFIEMWNDYLFILGINRGFNKKFESTITIICFMFKYFINLGG